jgi:hypothetical protein
MNACLRAVRLFPVCVAMLLSLSGCIKSKVTVFVNPDGSGHLVVSRLFGRQTVEAIEVQRQQMDAMEMPDVPATDEMKTRMKNDPFYDEKALQKEARSYGAGVKLAKSRRVDIDGGRGAIAVYSFKDVNDVFVSADIGRFRNMMYGGGMPDMDGDDGAEDGGRRGKGGLEFSLQTGEVSRLKILLPAFEPSDDDEEESSPSAEPGEDDDGESGGEDMAECFDPGMMAYQMPAGLDYRYAQQWSGNVMAQGTAVMVEVVVNGRIVTSSASHTNSANHGRIVLLDMDSSRRDKKGKYPGRMEDLLNSGDFSRLMSGLTKVPGAVVETNREVIVVFK